MTADSFLERANVDNAEINLVPADRTNNGHRFKITYANDSTIKFAETMHKATHILEKEGYVWTDNIDQTHRSFVKRR